MYPSYKARDICNKYLFERVSPFTVQCISKGHMELYLYYLQFLLRLSGDAKTYSNILLSSVFQCLLIF